MNQSYLMVFKQLGLSEAEARTYLANVYIGPSSVIKISQKAKITRQMIYTVMPKLKEMGLIKEIKKGSKTYFEATDPENLKFLVDKVSNQVKELIPELKTRQATSSAIPLVTVYENPLAMRDWYKNLLKIATKEDEILVWSLGMPWYELDASFYRKYIEKKNQIGVKHYFIGWDKSEEKGYKNQIKFEHAEYKYVKNWWKTNTEKWIFRDQTCYLTIKENATNMIVIESKELAAIEKFDFWRIWNSLK